MGFFKKVLNKISLKSTKDNSKNDVVLQKINENKENSSDLALKKSLEKTENQISKKIEKLEIKHKIIGSSYYKDLEEILLLSDVGFVIMKEIIVQLKEKVIERKIENIKEANEALFEVMFSNYLNEEIDRSLKYDGNNLTVYIVIGVNGVGKTTSIAKLSNRLQKEGKKVSLVAGDTFRAGAVKQLGEWANRLNIEIMKPIKEMEDPSSVAWRGIDMALENKSDVLIIDTAGRLENKKNLMKELEKLYKIINKKTGKDPEETLLVIDATTGQNGVKQAEIFKDLIGVSGIILTKMDSTSKGGIILPIKKYLNIPVKFIGYGESINDIEIFELDKYIYNMLLNFMKSSEKINEIREE